MWISNTNGVIRYVFHRTVQLQYNIDNTLSYLVLIRHK